MWASPYLRPLALEFAVADFFLGAHNGLDILYLSRSLSLPAAVIGGVIGAGNVGLLVSSLLAGRVLQRLGVGRSIIVSEATAVAGSAFIALAHAGMTALPLLVGAGWFLMAMPLLISFIATNSLLQAATPKPLLGRVTAAFGVMTGLPPFGAVAIGTFAQAVGLRPAMWLITVGMACALPFGIFSALRNLRALPAQAP